MSVIDPRAGQSARDLPAEGGGARSWWRPLLAVFITTCLVTGLSYGLPDNLAATGVGLGFLAATYFLALRGDADPRAFGLALGGLLQPEPLSASRLLREAFWACVWALGLGLLLYPAFWFGWLTWWKPIHNFSAVWPSSLWDESLGQLLVIALPEEAFYRGYVQTSLDRVWRPRFKLLGAHVGWGLLVSSALFALGHLATDVNANRLAVFFPALLFGWLRARTGGIGAAVAFHALCNMFATFLARSYGFAG